MRKYKRGFKRLMMNPELICVGKTGSGKTTLMKVLLSMTSPFSKGVIITEVPEPQEILNHQYDDILPL
jgi:ABC-type lipoprotein export system ATPase subunit